MPGRGSLASGSPISSCQAQRAISPESCDPGFRGLRAGRDVLCTSSRRNMGAAPGRSPPLPQELWVVAAPPRRAGSSAMTGPFTHSFPGRRK